MIRQLNCVLVCLITVLLAAGCVTDGGQVSTSGSSTARQGARGGDNVVMVMNGENIYARDLVSDNTIRQGLRQYIFFHNLRKLAAAEGVVADPVKIEDHVNLLKQRLNERGDTWEGYLSELSMSEDEYRSNIVDSLLQDGIVEKRVNVTDEKKRKIWDEQQDKVINEYMMGNHLPETERAGITYEDCEGLLFEKVLRIEGVPVQGDLMAELINTATLDLRCFASDEEAERYEFLILESAKKPAVPYTGNQETPPAESPGGKTATGDTAGGPDSAIGSSDHSQEADEAGE